MNHSSTVDGVIAPRRRPRRASVADLRSNVEFVAVEADDVERMPWQGRLRRRTPRSWVLAACGVLLAASAAALWVGSIDRAQADPPRVQAEPPAPTPLAATWVDINRPFPIYDVSGGDYGRLPLRYTARRTDTGSARQDVLTYGSPQPGEQFLKLVITRKDTESSKSTSLFVHTARLAGDDGLAVVRSGLSSSLQTRFGPFEVSGISISAAGHSAECLGFRSATLASPTPLELSGLACAPANRVIDLRALECTLNRLDLVSAGDDVELQKVFVEAERRRGPGCDSGHGASVASKMSASALRGTLSTLKGSIAPGVAKIGP